MSYNSKFEDLMDNINNVAQGYGFKNGIAWARTAQENREITWGQFKKYENAHNLRVRFSHGNAKDINVSYETYQVAKRFERDIENSTIRNNRVDNNSRHKNESKHSTTNNKPKTIIQNEMSYHEYFEKMYRYNDTPSLSYIAEEIKKELRTMRKFPKATYDDLVEAAFRIVKTYSPSDFDIIRTEYGCHTVINFFNKDAARKELAEKMVAKLSDYELKELMRQQI